MIWSQNYDPFGSPLLSTLISTLPVIVLLGGIGLLKMRAHVAALAGLATALAIAVLGFRMPVEMAGLAAGLTALFMAAMGTIGYVTKRDLTWLGRVSFVALLGLVVFGIVAIFVSIPSEYLIWSIAGLVIFAGLTVFDFWRLRRAGNADVALIALSIFLDAFNVFLFFLQILGGGSNR